MPTKIKFLLIFSLTPIKNKRFCMKEFVLILLLENNHPKVCVRRAYQ